MGTVFVTPYQNNNTKSPSYAKWFFRVFHTQTIYDSDLEDHISLDSKVERSKVGIIDDAITKQIGELLCNGHPIRIPHLGLLKMSVNSKGTTVSASITQVTKSQTSTSCLLLTLRSRQNSKA